MMIETREQYNEMFRTRVYSVGRFVPAGWGVSQIEDAQETIEALWEVARRASYFRDVIGEEEKDGITYPALDMALSALKEKAPWLLES